MPQPENSAEKEFESMIKEKKQQLAEHSLAQNLQTTCQAKSNTSVNHVAPKNVFHLVKQVIFIDIVIFLLARKCHASCNTSTTGKFGTAIRSQSL